MLNNYLLNKKWTFKEQFREDLVKKYFLYSLISVLSLIINLLILFVIVEFYDIWYIFAEIIAIMCSFLVNFFGNKILTFKEKKISE